ncbi:PD-(D/E)XK nuclease family protein [Clostridium sp. A1-XYC3]|uniref:PD-(D/E)XK nuclease family protein n=1 Tax=Clostridium tanneri TaxID=3037988 RepID=A0ABU4JWH4_9CLOT|nr:PD-(D/E)XK nuclease family protein [Clostridium sp. A1-XYC3]MDW8802504.1 PD-(D/E)XK nuclease family protein [Clostridium sp. A1-XYC3]
MEIINEKKCLENFIYNNEDMEKLEAITNEFNIFSALNIIRKEVRHSDFLAWLLNPLESHGLGDYFLKLLLKDVCIRNNNDSISIFDVDGINFDNAAVLREWHNIDIFIKDDSSKILCVIENKIDTSEHSNQLQRYRDIVDKEFIEYKKVFVYLTKYKEIPSDEEYIPYGYKDIVNLIEKLVNNKKDKLSERILYAISDYKEMVRRYIVENSEIQEICKKIYKQHKKALDLIYQYKPDIQSEAVECITSVLNENRETISMDDSAKAYLRFIPKELDFLPKTCSWTSSNRILLFEIRNLVRPVDKIEMLLLVGPCEQNIKDTLFELAQNNSEILKVNSKQTAKWCCIYKKTLIDMKKYDDEEENGEQIKEDLTKNLEKFINIELPKIISDIKKCEQVFVKERG